MRRPILFPTSNRGSPHSTWKGRSVFLKAHYRQCGSIRLTVERGRHRAGRRYNPSISIPYACGTSSEIHGKIDRYQSYATVQIRAFPESYLKAKATASATIQVNFGVGTDNEMNCFRPYAGTERLLSWNSVAARQSSSPRYEATTYEEATHTPKTPERRQLPPRRFRRLPDRILQPQHCQQQRRLCDFCVFGNPFDGSSEPGIVYAAGREWRRTS